MNTNLTKMPARRRLNSGELDVFDATLYFSGSLDHVTTDCPVGLYSSEKPMIRIIPPSQSQSTKVEKLVSNNKRSKQPSSPGAKLASFVNSIFQQTKSKSKSTHIPQAPKPLKDEEVEGHGWRENGGIRSTGFTRPPLRPIIPKPLPRKLRSYDSYKTALEVPLLVHETRSSEKNKAISDGFVGYRGVLNKYTNEFLRDDRIWLIEVLRRSFTRAENQVGDGDGDCNQSICSSDLFELENYDVGGLSNCLPVYGRTDMEVIKRNLVL